MLRFVKLLFILPIAAAIIALCFLNRAWVRVIYWPDILGGEQAVNVPLFGALIAMMMLGVIVGGLATWLTQSGHRRAERRYKREAETLKSEADRLKAAQPVPDFALPALKSR
ncbi:MAG: lipopolysaccharide assembly protein LapA domain-containing protein [Beijerinckiaceae bacterium]